MKTFVLGIAIFLSVLSSYAQKIENRPLLMRKLDSVRQEAKLLYVYEKIAWNGTDVLMSKPLLRKDYGGYVRFDSKDSIHITFLHKNQKQRIARYSCLKEDVNTPVVIEHKQKDLNAKEKRLLTIKMEVVKQLNNPKYKIGMVEGFSANLVLLPAKRGYRMYLIMGTTEHDIIPLGNDYLFWVSEEGQITAWKKFHKTMLAVKTRTEKNDKIIAVTHSHLSATPLISATDICTMKLYGVLYDIQELQVYSTALDCVFTYHIKTDKITVKEW